MPDVSVIKFPEHKEVSGPNDSNEAKLSTVILTVSEVILHPNESVILT
jgi:hypothetical protein